MDIGKWLLDFLESFKTTPLGVAVLFSLLVVIVLLLLIWLRTIQVADARDKREADLEEQRIEGQKEDDKRRAANDARLIAAVEGNGLAINGQNTLLSRVVSILERIDNRDAAINEMLRNVNDASEANAIKTTAIHKDLRNSATILNGKLDLVRTEADRHSETNMQIANNRAQEIQKSVRDSEKAVVGKIDEHGLLFDRVLDAVGDISDLVKALHRDFNLNVEAQAHREMGRMQQGSEVLNRFNIVEARLNEVMTVVYLLKRRGDTKELTPLDLPPEPIPQTPIMNPDPLAGKHDTQPLPVTPSVPAKPPEATN